MRFAAATHGAILRPLWNAGMGSQGRLDYKYIVRAPDIWWHLKVGDWIFENCAVPHNGIFSLTARNRPWVAHSWGYEVILSRVYHWFGLMGLDYSE